MNFAVEPRTWQWQFCGRAWNEICRTLRASDLISDSELDDLLFRFIGGREACEDFFGVPEYVLFPAMLTSPLFCAKVWRRDLGAYAFATPALRQTAALCKACGEPALEGRLFASGDDRLREAAGVGVADERERPRRRVACSSRRCRSATRR